MPICNLVELQSNTPEVLAGLALETQAGYPGSSETSSAYLSLLDRQYFSAAETNNYRLIVASSNMLVAMSGSVAGSSDVANRGARLTLALRDSAITAVFIFSPTTVVNIINLIGSSSPELSVVADTFIKPFLNNPTAAAQLSQSPVGGISLSPNNLGLSSLSLALQDNSPELSERNSLETNASYSATFSVSQSDLALSPINLVAEPVVCTSIQPYKAKLTSGTTINPEVPGEEVVLGKSRSVASFNIIKVGISAFDVLKTLTSDLSPEFILNSVALISTESITSEDVGPLDLELNLPSNTLDILLRLRGPSVLELTTVPVLNTDFIVTRDFVLPAYQVNAVMDVAALAINLSPMALLAEESVCALDSGYSILDTSVQASDISFILSSSLSELSLSMPLEPNGIAASFSAFIEPGGFKVDGALPNKEEYPALFTTNVVQFVLLAELQPTTSESFFLLDPIVLSGFALELEGTVDSSLTTSSPSLAGVAGFTEAPTQFQEFFKYPVPTGGSAAFAIDENSNYVYPSTSVFGAMATRVGSGQPGTSSISTRVRAAYIGQPGDYSTVPETTTTAVFLRSSILDTTSTQRALLGSDALGPNVTRLATYSDLPRSYNSSVASMGSGGATTLASENAFSFGTFQNPNRPVLFLGSALVRHNNTGPVIEPAKSLSVASDFYYPASAGYKLAPSRVESTVGSYSEGISPLYSASTFRLLTQEQFQNYAVGSGTFQINSAILPQDEVTAGTSASLHASDAMFGFYPIKQGVRYFYSRHRPSTTAFGLTVSSAAFLGGTPEVPNIEFTVQLQDADSNIVNPSVAFSQGADCALRLTIYPYEASNFISTVVVDIPVLGVSALSTSRIVIDSSYRWFVQNCLPGAQFEFTHSVKCMKDNYSVSNSITKTSSRTVLAASRPIALIDSDQGESEQALLSRTGDRNLIMGEFSLAMSRPNVVFETGVRINTPGTDFEILDADTEGTALATSSFDVNSLHLFINTDGTLGGKRIIQTEQGYEYDTNLDPILPYELLAFIDAGGKFTKVKVGESVTALLTEPQDQLNGTGRRLYLWGYNTFGHLTVPATVDANYLSQGYIDNVKDFDFSTAHIAVIMETGELYSWGCNTSGTVWFDRDSGTPPVTEFAIGENFSVAYVRRNNGSSVVEKIEQYGDAPNPASVPSLTLKARTEVYTAATHGITVYAGEILACGKSHAAALKSDGTVVCWGDNTYGQCDVPVSLSDVIGIAVGDNHCLALKSDGTVVAWGDNTYGQTTVPANLNAKMISAGGNFSAAIRSSSSTDVSAVNGSVTDDEVEDTVACWGRNDQGQCNVPSCEGLSYDPSAHRYRMRFWHIDCGWDHMVGVRKDNVVAKAARDHLELTRYLATKTRFALKNSSNNVIFPDLNFATNLGWSGTTATIATRSGYPYSITQISGDIDFATTFFTADAGANKYRLKISTGSGSSTEYAFNGFVIQHTTDVTPTEGSWADLLMDYRIIAGADFDFAWPPSFDTGTWGFPGGQSFQFYDLTRQWAEDPSNWGTPRWTVGLRDTGQQRVLEYTVAPNGEYFDCDFTVADTEMLDLDKKQVVWGNPTGYTVDCDPTTYETYYPQFDWSTGDGLEDDLRGALTDDAVAGSAFTVPSEPLKWSSSYVGYGRQLGACPNWTSSYEFFISNQLIMNNILSNSVYLGPSSIRIAPETAVQVSRGSDILPKAYGTPHLTYFDSGTSRLFNAPTPVSSSTVRLFVTPEMRYNNYETGQENFITGFSDNAVYVENFPVSLPSGFAIVANGHASLPANTEDSLTGYHLTWTGIIPAISTSSAVYVVTGMRWDTDRLILPFDPQYQSNANMDLVAVAFMGLQLRNVQVLRHQTSQSAVNVPGLGSFNAAAMKHMTRVPRYSSFDFSLRNVGYGLTISANSLQGGTAVQYEPLDFISIKDPTDVPNDLYGQKAYFNYRSFIGFKRTPFYIDSNLSDPNSVKRISLVPAIGGDNTKGQLNISILGPFPYNAELSSRGLQTAPLGTSWLMNLGQTNIGHTQNPSLTYGFKSVSCGQFHTLAIDEDDWVHAAGSNSAIRPAALTRKGWTPYVYSWNGCGEFDPRNPPHLITGYFRNFSDTNDSGVPGSFLDDRSNSSFPSGADNRDLQTGGTGYLFNYPNAPRASDTDCIGNYDTNCVAIYDDSIVWSEGEVVLFNQSANSGPTVKVGLERTDFTYRFFACDNLNENKTYSAPLVGPPRLIFISVMPSSNAEGVFQGYTVAVKADGEYYAWENSTYLSDVIPALRFSRFLDYVGDAPTGIINARALSREFMPVSPALTSLVAGDSYFFAFYKDAATDDKKIVGTLTLPSGPNLGVSDPIAQGPLLDGADMIVGPKGYFITRVERSYKKVAGSKPADTPYAAVNTNDVTTIRYNPNDNNGEGTFKIYVGPTYGSQVGEGSNPGDQTLNFNHNYTSGDPVWGSDSAEMTWPKIIFRDDVGPDGTTTLWNAIDDFLGYPLAYAPHEIMLYQSGYGLSAEGANTPFEHENENEFRIGVTFPGIEINLDNVYPAKTVTPDPFAENADINSPEYVITYDAASRRLLPQGYRPAAAPSGGCLSVAVGPKHSLIVNSDNTVTTWGANSYNQRALVENVSNAAKAVTNGSVTLVLTDTGSIEGYSFFGEFDTLISNIPSGTDFTDISIGDYHALALRSNGTVVAWGTDFGSGSVNGLPSNLPPCQQVACGGYHSVALTSTGSVVVWGNTSVAIPTAIQNGVATYIACTYNGVAARLQSDGNVYFWGSGYSGNSGYACDNIIGSNYNRFYVVRTSTGAIESPETQPAEIDGEVIDIPAGTGWTKLGQGVRAYHMVACTASAVFAWGTNYDEPGVYNEGGWRGQAFIPGGNNERLGVIFSPVGFVTEGPFKHVAISVPGSENVSTYVSQIPDSIRARNETAVYTESDISAMKHVIDIASGDKCFFAVVGDTAVSTSGSIVGWGFDPSNSGILSGIPTATDFTKISCRNLHAAALDADGDIHAWGRSTEGATVVPNTLDDGNNSGCLDVVCGDTFTVAVKSDNLLEVWGQMDGQAAALPQPFDSVKLYDVTCGVSHIAGRVFESYGELVQDGNFRLNPDDAVAFSLNNAGATGECALPGFKYAVNNNGINCPVVAGGNFTGYLMPSNGFEAINTAGAGNKSLIFASLSNHEDPEAEVEDELDSELIEGYLIHTSGALCAGILPETHNFYFNPPTRTRSPDNELFFDINYSNAFTNIFGRQSGATAIPAAYARDGSRKAKLVAAGRCKQWKYDTVDHVFGVGYSVIIDSDTNNPVMVGGDYLPTGCSIDSYPAPPQSIALKDVPFADLAGEEIVQVDTYRANVYVLTAGGRVVRWGYSDVTSASGVPLFDYSVDDTARSFMTIPDMAMTDSLAGAQWQDTAMIGMSYIAGLPGITNYWSVEVHLDRYVDGQKSTLRKFAATGNSELYPVDKPIHFSETFLHVDTWPDNAVNIDTQYVLSVIPRGITCDINSASIFGMNLDSKGTAGQPILIEADAVSSNSQIADFFISTISGALPATAINNISSSLVLSASEQIYDIAVTSNSNFEYPSYITNPYGSSARLESASGNTARVGGRVATVEDGSSLTIADLVERGLIPQPIVWLNSDTLPATGTEVSSWSTDSTASTAFTFSQGSNTRYPSVVSFNTNYKGIQLDSTSGEEDYLQTSGGAVTAYTAFLVYNKTNAANRYNSAFVLHPQGGSRTPYGFAFDQGNPVLCQGVSYYDTTGGATTGNHILCANYAGTSSYSLRQDGQALTLGSAKTTGLTGAANLSGTGFYLGRNVFRSAEFPNDLFYHDNNDVYAEAIWFVSTTTNTLTAEQIELVEGYLAHKYNLTSLLPNDHPYKTAFNVPGRIQSSSMPGLYSVDLIDVETARAIPSSGTAQSWIGMFEVGVNYKSNRSGQDHHAPVAAEFDLYINNSFSLLAPICEPALAVAAANLTVSTIANAVYLDGDSALELEVASADIQADAGLPAVPISGVLDCQPAALFLNLGLSGTAAFELGIFGAEYCIPGYGCFGTSTEPPTLEILEIPIVILPVSGVLDVAATVLSQNITIEYGRIRLISEVASVNLGLNLGIESDSAAVLSVSSPVLRSGRVDLGLPRISSNLSVIVCQADFAILGQDSKKYATTYTKPSNVVLADSELGPAEALPAAPKSAP